MKNAPRALDEGGVEGAYASDEGFAFHNYMKRKLGEKGWLSRPWPKEYGGSDATVIEQLIFSTKPGKSTRRRELISGALTCSLPPLSFSERTNRKKDCCRPLPRVKSSTARAGVSPMPVRIWPHSNHGHQDGDVYVINGQKVWTTAAHRADHMFILARTDPNSTRSRGLSVFNLPMNTPGIDVRPILFMDKNHVYTRCFLRMSGFTNQTESVKENDGWRSTRETMNFERSGIRAYTRGKKNSE